MSKAARSGAQTAGLLPWSIAYDDRGRVAAIERGLRRADFAYDPVTGYLQRSTDPLSYTTTYTRDAVGQVITLTQPDTATWGFEWDENGNLQTLTEPDLSTRHTFTYTQIDQLGSYHSPLGAVETFTFNKDRELVKRQYPSGQAVEWVYNPQGQLTALQTPEGNHTFVYSATTGMLSRATSRDGQQIDYAYDGGLLTRLSHSGQVTDTVRYTYTNDLLLTHLSYAGATIPITYDRDDLVTGIGSITLTHRPENGLLTGLIDGGYHEIYTYTPYSEVASMIISHGPSRVQRDLQLRSAGAHHAHRRNDRRRDAHVGLRVRCRRSTHQRQTRWRVRGGVCVRSGGQPYRDHQYVDRAEPAA